MKKLFYMIFLGFSFIVQAQTTKQFPLLKGDYLGQTPPGKKAVKFAPGILSLSNRGETVIAFSPDGNECYFTCNIGDSYKIYYTKRVNNIWTEQKEAPFSVNQDVVLSGLSADGKRLFFEKDNDIWKVERTAIGWGEPQRLTSPINSTSSDHSYSETDGGIVYIGSNRPGGLGNSLEIWCILPSSDRAENLGPIINSTLRNLTPCIAPDGSYLIYTQSNGYYEHLYISFNKGNKEWTVPVNMDITGAEINFSNYQNRPTLSPDGKYLFFNNHDPDDGNNADIYWVSTKVIDDIKKEIFRPMVTK